jgi:hypothetical protein
VYENVAEQIAIDEKEEQEIDALKMMVGFVQGMS